MPLTANVSKGGKIPSNEGVRDLLGRLLRWRLGLHWYLFVLFGLPWASCSRRPFARRGTARGARAELGLALHTCSCRASSCPSCTPTCRRSGFLAVNAAGQARALACEPDSGPILRALPRWSGEAPNQASSAEAWEDLLSHVLTGPVSLSEKALAS